MLINQSRINGTRSNRPVCNLRYHVPVNRQAVHWSDCSVRENKGKPRVYDLRNKLAEYVETAQRESLTPLTHAICDHGAETFSIEKLEICNADVVDVRESMYIDAYGTLVPNGYNCYGTNVEAELKGINHRGQLGKVCLRVRVKGLDDEKMLMFGCRPETFNDSVAEAKRFCNHLGIKTIILHSSLEKRDELWWPYKKRSSSLTRNK